MEFLNTTMGLVILVYLGIGCIIMKLVDRGDRDINTIAWIIGVVGWLPVALLGFYAGYTKKR
jgi:hypothetical protein